MPNTARLETIKKKLRYLFPGASELWLQVIGKTLHQAELASGVKIVHCSEEKDDCEEKD